MLLRTTVILVGVFAPLLAILIHLKLMMFKLDRERQYAMTTQGILLTSHGMEWSMSIIAWFFFCRYAV